MSIDTRLPLLLSLSLSLSVTLFPRHLRMPPRILVRKLEQVRQFVAARVVSLRQFRDILLSILSETLGRGSLPRAELDIISRVGSNFDTFLSLSSTCNRSNTRARSGRATGEIHSSRMHGDVNAPTCV